MSSRRQFLRSTMEVGAAFFLPDLTPHAFAQKADLTTAQMREGGRSVKLSLQQLRENVTLVAGSGGNVIVLDSQFNGLYPFIDYNNGGSIDGMIAACRENLALAGPSTVVVCGHGPTGTRVDIVAFEAMLQDVRGKVARAKQAGASVEEVLIQSLTALYDPQWGRGFIFADLFTRLVYRGV